MNFTHGILKVWKRVISHVYIKCPNVRLKTPINKTKLVGLIKIIKFN